MSGLFYRGLLSPAAGGGGGGGGGGAICGALDPATSGSHLTLSGSNLIATSSGAGDTGVRGDTGRSTGKWYFEMNFAVGTTGGDTGAGLALASATYAGLGGSSTGGTMVFHNGNIWVNGVFSGINVGNVEGATLGIAVDLDNARVWYRKNAGIWNGIITNDPVTNVGGRDISSLVGALKPVLTLTNNTESITANFAGTFVGTPPTGFF